MSEELVQYESGGLSALSPNDVMRQVNLIQEIMRQAMREGEHFGKIPGCGDKPSLLKPGAEKIGLTFRLAPKYDIEETDLPGGHKEYKVISHIYHGPTNTFLGSGVGVATTMESKWRYRTGPTESTGKSVPKEYWDKRKSDPNAAKELIGGDGYSTKKIDGKWEIVIQGEKIEHDNPADYYNTCLKMAKKRAQVDGILTATAASDIFTQDIEESPELYGGRQPSESKQDKSSTVKQRSSSSNENPAKEKVDIKTQFKDLLLKFCCGDMLKMQAVLKEITEYNGQSVDDIDSATDKRIKVAFDKLNKRIKDDYPEGCSLDPTACNNAGYDGDIPYCSTGKECQFSAEF